MDLAIFNIDAPPVAEALYRLLDAYKRMDAQNIQLLSLALAVEMLKDISQKWEATHGTN